MDLESIARAKDAVGRAAAELVEDGMLVGLGSGSTAARFIIHLAERRKRIRCVATSPATDQLARSLGLEVEPFATLAALGRLDLAVDGADQVAPDRWIVKGGGGAHLRERVVADHADRYVVIVDGSKLVDRIHAPIPLELDDDRVAEALAALDTMGGGRIRDGWSPSPDGGVIADYLGAVDDPGGLAERLVAVPGLVAHGLFAPTMVSEIIVGRGATVERLPAT